MKKMTALALLTLLSTQAFSAQVRDASLQMSSKASEQILDAGKSSVDATISVADFTADKLKAFISKNFASSIEASGKIGDAIVKISEVSKPVFRLTADGIAMVFDVSANAGEISLKASEKLVVLLDPSLEISSDVLIELLKQLSKGSELSSEITEKILIVLGEVLEKPFEYTDITLEKLSKILTKGSEASSEVTEFILGAENVKNGLELSGRGISLTSEGIFAALYFVTKSVSAISDIFEVNREEIEKAVERNDQDTLVGLRELIRSEIEKSVNGGEALNQLLSDNDLDFYIEARLMADKQ